MRVQGTLAVYLGNARSWDMLSEMAAVETWIAGLNALIPSMLPVLRVL